MKDLKRKAIRGGFAKLCSQAASFLLRTGSLVILARMLVPKDFGIVGMVTAVIGVLNLFKDCGLSLATVQQATVTDEQSSTLFWINLLNGTVLAVLCVSIAPAIAAFYHEPRLVAVTTALATAFVFNAAGIQHSAKLQRQMRFTILSIIDVLSLLISSTVGIGMAKLGYGYWSLVYMALIGPLFSTICMWLSTRWVPGPPRRHVGLGSAMRFGGTVTANSLIVYVAYNLDNLLIGRVWGAQALGIYGRAYTLINLPGDNLLQAVGGVAFPTLARVQNVPGQLRSFFLKFYSFVLGLTLPATLLCALFAPELIFVILGSKWSASVPIFRVLVPAMLMLSMINPFSWLLFATGRVGRSLKIAVVIIALSTTGYLFGLPYGPKGVALGFSIAMMLWVVPNSLWCIQGTTISFQDIIHVVRKPFVSGITAALVAYLVRAAYGQFLPPLPRLVLGSAVFLGAYGGLLLYVMGEKAFYLDLIRGLRRSSEERDQELVLSA